MAGAGLGGVGPADRRSSEAWRWSWCPFSTARPPPAAELSEGGTSGSSGARPPRRRLLFCGSRQRRSRTCSGSVTATATAGAIAPTMSSFCDPTWQQLTRVDDFLLTTTIILGVVAAIVAAHRLVYATRVRVHASDVARHRASRGCRPRRQRVRGAVAEETRRRPDPSRISVQLRCPCRHHDCARSRCAVGRAADGLAPVTPSRNCSIGSAYPCAGSVRPCHWLVRWRRRPRHGGRPATQSGVRSSMCIPRRIVDSTPGRGHDHHDDRGAMEARVVFGGACTTASTATAEIGAAARLAIDNERLRAEVLAQLMDLHESQSPESWRPPTQLDVDSKETSTTVPSSGFLLQRSKLPTRTRSSCSGRTATSPLPPRRSRPASEQAQSCTRRGLHAYPRPRHLSGNPRRSRPRARSATVGVSRGQPNQSNSAGPGAPPRLAHRVGDRRIPPRPEAMIWPTHAAAPRRTSRSGHYPNPAAAFSSSAGAPTAPSLGSPMSASHSPTASVHSAADCLDHSLTAVKKLAGYPCAS